MYFCGVFLMLNVLKFIYFMEVTGKVIEIKPVFTTNGGKEKYEFILETSGEYPQRVPFEVWGAERWSKMQVRVGMQAAVSFDIRSREWNGKYILSLGAWKVQSSGSSTAASQQGSVQSSESRVSTVSSDSFGGSGQSDVPF